jgi:hypothetical protein
VFPLFNSLEVEALLGTGLPGKGVWVGVSNALTAFGFEVIFLQMLNPWSGLSLQISKAQPPSHGGVVGA